MLGCPIRISADQFVCANPRSFSQLITSFIASESLGIPHTLLFSLLYFLLFLMSYYYLFICCSCTNNYNYFIIESLIYISCIFFNMSMNVVSNNYLNHYSVENIGVEPMTSCVQGRRSSQLS